MTNYSYHTKSLIERRGWESLADHEILEAILEKLRRYPLGQYYLKTYTIYTKAFKEVLKSPNLIISGNSSEVALDLLKNTITFASGIKEPII